MVLGMKEPKLKHVRSNIFFNRFITFLLILLLIAMSILSPNVFYTENSAKAQAKTKSIIGDFNRNGILLGINSKFKLKLSKATLRSLKEKAKKNEENYEDVVDSIKWKIKNSKVAKIKTDKNDKTQCQVIGLKFGYTKVVASVNIGDSIKNFTCQVDVFDKKKKLDNLNKKLKRHVILIRPCTTNSVKYDGYHPAFIKLEFDFLREKKSYVDTDEGVIHKKGLWKNYNWDMYVFKSKDNYKNYVDDDYYVSDNYDSENYEFMGWSEIYGNAKQYGRIFSHPYIYYNKKGKIYGCDNKDGSGRKYR